MERLPQLTEGHSHGQQQEGGLKGYNPRCPGRVSHHPLLAVLAESSSAVSPIRRSEREIRGFGFLWLGSSPSMK